MHWILFTVCLIGFTQSRPSSIIPTNDTDYANYDGDPDPYHYISNGTLNDHNGHHEIPSITTKQPTKNVSKTESLSDDYTAVLRALDLPADFIDGGEKSHNSLLPDTNSQSGESESQEESDFPEPSKKQPIIQSQLYMTGNLQLDTVLNCPCQRFQLDALGLQGYPYHSKPRPPATHYSVTEPPIRWESVKKPPPDESAESQQGSVTESIVTFVQVLRFLRQVPTNLKSGFMNILRHLVCPTKNEESDFQKGHSFGRNRTNLLSLGSQKVVSRHKVTRTQNIKHKKETIMTSNYDKRFDRWVAVMKKYLSNQIHLVSVAAAASKKNNFTNMSPSDLWSEASDSSTSISAPFPSYSANFMPGGVSNRMRVGGPSSIFVPDANQTNGKVLLIVPLDLHRGNVESQIRQNFIQNDLQNHHPYGSNLLMRV